VTLLCLLLCGCSGKLRIKNKSNDAVTYLRIETSKKQVLEVRDLPSQAEKELSFDLEGVGCFHVTGRFSRGQTINAKCVGYYSHGVDFTNVILIMPDGTIQGY
jgi:hypothetical protein